MHKLTSSFTISYQPFGSEERQVVDIGLNIKNYFKKCHVPGYVRYTEEETAVEEKGEESKGASTTALKDG